MRNKQVVLIGDSVAPADELAFAESIGRVVGRRGWGLVTGGRDGVMEAASRGCREEGGLVIGILPTEDDSSGNDYCHFLVPTGLGWTRNSINTLAGDVVIAIGGRAGTLSEIAYAWMFGKPLLAVTGFGGWSEKLAGEKIDDRRDDLVVPVADIAEVETGLLRALGEAE